MAKPPRWTWFYSADPQPCPYLEGRTERRLVTPLAGREARDDPLLFDRLTEAGFRRSQMFAYSAACPGCSACVSVRVPVARFSPNRGFRKVLARNADLTSRECAARSTDEQFALFRAYVATRHVEGGMAEMDRAAFAIMIEQAPPGARVIEHRAPGGALVAACLIDRVESGLSGVYKFFDPGLAKRSLGTFTVLSMIEWARACNLPYVYLGYWIEGCGKMSYKARFRPLEKRAGGAWVDFDAPAGKESAMSPLAATPIDAADRGASAGA